jgi:peptidyl-prolyl cis-trans isomerase D
MLQALRGGAKSPIMKVFLVFLAAGFALWGVGDMTTGLIGGSDKAISAGKQSLSPREVAVKFDLARRNYLPNATMGEALESGLLPELAGALARDVVFRAEADRLGIAVTRDMQRDAVANEPSFRDELGNFSQSRFISVLANAGLTEAEYLQEVDTALRRTQIVDAVASGVGIIEPRMFAASIDVSDSEVETAYQDRIDEFTTPERRRLRQMVFDDRAAADTAFARLTDGEDFTAVATDTLGWTEGDTQLGLVARGDLDDAIAEAAFAASTGDVTGPVESAFGFHLIAIDEVVAGGESSLADVSETIRAALQAEAAIDMIFEKANILEDFLASGATIDEAIKEVGGRLVTLRDIDRRGNDIDGAPFAGDDADLAQDSLVLDTIWSNEIDDLSVIQEGTNDMFFVVEVTAETEPRTRDLTEVRTRAIGDWKLVEAIKAAREKATALSTDETAFAASAETTAFRRTGTGLDHEAARLIASAAFGQDIGENQIVETGSEAIAVRTERITPAEDSELTETAQLLRNFTSRAIQQDILGTLSADLSRTHDLQIRLGGVQQLLIGSQ